MEPNNWIETLCGEVGEALDEPSIGNALPTCKQEGSSICGSADCIGFVYQRHWDW